MRVLVMVVLVACGGSPPANRRAPAAEAGIAAAAATITADVLRDHITRLSADALEGRGPTTRGDTAARALLVEQLKALGYEPAGPGGAWEQPFDVVSVTAAMPAKWTFSRGAQSLALEWSKQYMAASGVQTERGAIRNAELVFVGYGIQAPEFGWDDFKGQNLRGKVLVMLNNDPDWDPALFAGTTRLYYGRWSYKYESAARQGAAGAIIIHTTPSAGYPFQVIQTSWSGPQFELPDAGEPRIQVQGWVTEDAARALVKLAGKDLATLVEQARKTTFAPVPLGITTSLEFTNKLARGQTANVFGVLRGADPELAPELVVYTAHHDHLGIGKPDARGDTIYNGAMDNAAGCAQLLAIAKAFKALPSPPRRSVLMLFVAAEEQGLLGSAYFAAHPIVAPAKIAVDINYDGGNIWGRTRDVTYVGKGRSTLDALVDTFAARQGRTVKPDQFPDRGSFYRSDQFSFARIGVPSVYLHVGTDFIGRPAGWGREQIEAYEKRDYHQPSDHIRPEWVFDGMIQDAELGFRIGLAVANADALPAWTPGDEFEAARKGGAPVTAAPPPPAAPEPVVELPPCKPEPRRDARQLPGDVVAMLELSPGMTVVDLGSGSGYFLCHLAHAVAARGKVIATEVTAPLVRGLEARVTKEQLPNVEVVKAPLTDTGIAPGTADRILIVNVWHHLTDRKSYAQRIARALAPGGKVVVVDFRPAGTHGIKPERVIAELTAAGFDAALVPEKLPDQYVIVGSPRASW
jgi:Zn-dependent M28 family amino/carboxypeptidase